MPETTDPDADPDLYRLLLDRLRHGAQYAEACRVKLEDAIALVEEALEGRDRACRGGAAREEDDDA